MFLLFIFADLLKHDKQLARVAPSKHLGSMPAYIQTEEAEAAKEGILGPREQQRRPFFHRKRKREQGKAQGSKKSKDQSHDPLRTVSKKRQ